MFYLYSPFKSAKGPSDGEQLVLSLRVYSHSAQTVSLCPPLICLSVSVCSAYSPHLSSVSAWSVETDTCISAKATSQKMFSFEDSYGKKLEFIFLLIVLSPCLTSLNLVIQWIKKLYPPCLKCLVKWTQGVIFFKSFLHLIIPFNKKIWLYKFCCTFFYIYLNYNNSNNAMHIYATFAIFSLKKIYVAGLFSWVLRHAGHIKGWNGSCKNN